MPRSMSFFHTQEQIRNETKTHTLRRGWEDLKPGELFWAVEKGQGLKRGERVKRMKLLRCVRNRPMQLNRITDKQVAQEGFPEMTRKQFIAFFRRNMGGHERQVLNAITFEYVPRDEWPAEVSA